MLQTFPPEALVPVCAYGGVLTLLLPVHLGFSIWSFVNVTIAGLLAQLAGTAMIRTMEMFLPVSLPLECVPEHVLDLYSSS